MAQSLLLGLVTKSSKHPSWHISEPPSCQHLLGTTDFSRMRSISCLMISVLCIGLRRVSMSYTGCKSQIHPSWCKRSSHLLADLSYANCHFTMVSDKTPLGLFSVTEALACLHAMVRTKCTGWSLSSFKKWWKWTIMSTLSLILI